MIGDQEGEKSVEIFDPSTNSWSEGVPIPVTVYHCAAVTFNGKIYVVGANRARFAPTT